MTVVKITTKDGRVFHNAEHGAELIARTLPRLDWQRFELVEMTPAEYQSIPTSREAKDLFAQ